MSIVSIILLVIMVAYIAFKIGWHEGRRSGPPPLDGGDDGKWR